MTPRKLIGAADVAALLGYGSVVYFKRVHRALERARKFPAPLRRCPLLWDPAAIAAWQDAQLPATGLKVEIAAPWERKMDRFLQGEER